MRFLIYANVTRPDAVRTARAAEERLRALGHTCVRAEDAPAEDLTGTDMCLVTGGDGTILRAVRALYTYGFPFLGVNCGHLGYLSECEPAGMDSLLEKISAGDYRLEKRAMLHGVLRQESGETAFFSLNEAALHRCDYAHSLGTELLVDGVSIMNFTGDGLLIATPTGSTAYNLAAGGPILLPEARHLAVTPVCAHSGLHAPIVVSDRQVITVRSGRFDPSGETGRPQLIVDGCFHVPLDRSFELTCGIAPQGAAFVRTGSRSFYRRLQRKMLAIETAE